jgi:hypothetical protein
LYIISALLKAARLLSRLLWRMIFVANLHVCGPNWYRQGVESPLSPISCLLTSVSLFISSCHSDEYTGDHIPSHLDDLPRKEEEEEEETFK